MANMLFDAARARMLGGNGDANTPEFNTSFSWLATNGIEGYLFIGSSAPASSATTLANLAAADWQYALTGGGNQTAGIPLTGTAVTLDGAADASPVTFTSVDAANPQVSAVFLTDNTGTSAGTITDNRLVLWIDTATGLPITPNGGDIIVTWDTGINKIFRP